MQLSTPICAYVFHAVSFLQVFRPRPSPNDASQSDDPCNICYHVNFHGYENFLQNSSWRIILYKPSVVAYSIYSCLETIAFILNVSITML